VLTFFEVDEIGGIEEKSLGLLFIRLVAIEIILEETAKKSIPVVFGTEVGAQ
jgi:hypothetical protein